MTGPKKRIGLLSEGAGDWGGASRVLFTNLLKLDREKFDYQVLIPNPGPIVETLDAHKIPWTLWGRLHEPRGIVRYGADIWRALQLFRQLRLDLLHINHLFWRPAEVLAARLLGIPVIAHCHLPGEPGPAVSQVDLVITNSRYTTEVLSRYTDVPVEVVYPCVDIDRYRGTSDLRAELGLRPEAVVVTFAGQIKREKGVDLFVQMAHRFVANPDIEFIIAGECRPGGLRPDELKTLIDGHPQLHYLGYRSDIDAVYLASDIVVVPSRWDEPFGLINIEAGAAGKPVIATRVGGIPEIIQHGENGLLVERDDLDGLTRAVHRLAQDPSLRQAMGQRGRELVRTRFQHQPITQLEAIYERLTLRPSARQRWLNRSAELFSSARSKRRLNQTRFKG